MIEVISGTNRPQCNAVKVARLLLRFYEQQDQPAQLLNLQELPAEIFHPGSYAQKPAAFQPFQERILQADGLHVVVPEYNGSFPGVLKYFIDMLKFPESFAHRCVAFTGEAAGIWGAFRAVEQIQMVFGYRNAYIMPERVWIPGINDKWTASGTDFADEALMERLRDQARRFSAFVARNKGQAAHA